VPAERDGDHDRFDRMIEISGKPQPILVAAALGRVFDGGGDRCDLRGADGQRGALQGMGRLAGCHDRASALDGGQEAPALLLKELQQFPLELPVAEGLGAKMREIEGACGRIGACHQHIRRWEAGAHQW
jgi:hypothetical protein